MQGESRRRNGRQIGIDGRGVVTPNAAASRRKREFCKRHRNARNAKLTLRQKREAIRRRDKGKETAREIARSYNVSHSTISRLLPSSGGR
jgi:IS30 family transposase